MTLLDSINSPKDLKKLNNSQLTELCEQIREYLINCCATNPGHLGASLGTVELSVALHYVFNTPIDKIVWDVGHQAYAHKIITGRKEAFINNRKYKGISGFPKMTESEYDSFGTGHSSTSISAALGIAAASQLNKTKNQVIAVIGDGALTGGLAFEGLNNAGGTETNILVIVNDNGIAIDKNVGALHNYLLKISTSKTYNNIKNKIWHRLGSSSFRKFIQKITLSTKIAIFKKGTIFEALGFRYFGSINGNDIGQLITTLNSLKEIDGPKLLHVITKKGKGYKVAEDNQVVWHAPGTFHKESGKLIKSKSYNSKYQDVFGHTLLDLARQNDKIVGITPAMPSGCSMNIMMEEMPNRVFDVGIAEQHAVTFSAGLAANGILPICNIYSSFMQRAYDGIIHDIAIQNLKAIFCLDRAGIVGEDGATHHGTFDLAHFRSIPNICIAAPMDEIELRQMLYSATLEHNPTTIIRYPRGEGIGLDWQIPFEEIKYGKGRQLCNGEDIAILSIGTIGHNISKAIEKLKKADESISIAHYDMRYLKPIDTNILKLVTDKYKNIITVEDGTIVGGLFSSVSEYASNNGSFSKIIPIGIPDKFIEQGSIQELQKECGMDTNTIIEVILDLLKKSDN